MRNGERKIGKKNSHERLKYGMNRQKIMSDSRKNYFVVNNAGSRLQCLLGRFFIFGKAFSWSKIVAPRPRPNAATHVPNGMCERGIFKCGIYGKVTQGRTAPNISIEIIFKKSIANHLARYGVTGVYYLGEYKSEPFNDAF